LLSRSTTAHGSAASPVGNVKPFANSADVVFTRTLIGLGPPQSEPLVVVAVKITVGFGGFFQGRHEVRAR